MLAHELGHVTMRSFPPLSPSVTEGLCELVAYIWLSCAPVDASSTPAAAGVNKPGGRDVAAPSVEAYRKFRVQMIAENKDPVPDGISGTDYFIGPFGWQSG